MTITLSNKIRTAGSASAIAIATTVMATSQAMAAPAPVQSVPTPTPPAAPANPEECAVVVNMGVAEIVCAPGTDPDGIQQPFNSISATVQAGSQVQGEIELLVGADVTIDGAVISSTGAAIDVGAASNVVNNGFVSNTTTAFAGMIRTGDGSTVTNNGVITSIQSSQGGIESNSNSTVINNGEISLSGFVTIGITGTGSVSPFGSDTGVTVLNSSTGSIIVGPGIAGIFLGTDATVTNDGLVQTFGAGAEGIIVGDASTVTNNGFVVTTGVNASGIQTGNDSTVVNTGAGRIFTSGDSKANILVGTNSTVQNNGVISTQGDRAVGVVARNGSTVTNNPTGQIATTGDTAHGVIIVDDGTLLNIGGLIQTTGNDADAVIITGAGTVDNSGRIISINRRGLDLADASTVTNRAGGSISGGGDGIRFNANGSTLTNAGTIEGTANGALGVNAIPFQTVVDNSGVIRTSGQNAAALYVGVGSTVNNSGEISASADNAVAFAGGAGTTLTNAAGGTISTLGMNSGAVVFVADGTLVNDGTISTLRTDSTGVTALGDLILTNTGSITATSARAVDMKDGIVTNEAGASITGATDGIRTSGSALAIVNNRGAITGGDNGVLGGLASEFVYNLGSITGGTAAANLRDGADAFLSINDATETGTVDGGADFDVFAKIITDGTDRTFNLDLIGTQFVNFEDLRFGSQTFDYTTFSLAVPPATGVLTLTGTTANDITIINTGILDGTVNGTVGLLQGANTGIAPVFSVTGNGVIAAMGDGVVVVQDGWTINNAGSINSTGALGINAIGQMTTVNNTGTISTDAMNAAGVYVGDGSTVTNDGIISASANSAVALVTTNGSTITNNAAGTISAAGDGSHAIVAVGDATITNDGAISTTGAGSTAVIVTGASTINNNGTVMAADGRGLDLALASTVNNAAGASITSGTSDGIRFNADGSVLNNNGAVSGDTGVTGSLGADTIVNFGSITGTTSGASLSLGADIFQQWTGATVVGGINMGGGADTVIVEGSTSSVTGTIDGGADTDTIILAGILDSDNIANFETVQLGSTLGGTLNDLTITGNRTVTGDIVHVGDVFVNLGVDSLTTTGAITLASTGTLTIDTPLNEALAGQTVSVFEGSSITDNGATVNILDDDLLVDYALLLNNGVQVQVNFVNPLFSNPDPNLNAFGNAVVGGLGAGTVNAATFAQLNGLSAAQFQTAAQDALPGISDGLGREIFESASFSSQALERHLAGQGSAIWGEFGIRGAQQDALSASADGYDSDQLIFTLGADLLVNDGARIGVIASFADIDNTDLRGDTQPTETTDAESIKLGAYAGITLFDRGFLHAELAYLTGQAETARGGFFGATASEFDFSGFIGGATFGYDLLPDENVSITPSIGVNFARINFEDAQEVGGFGFLVERGDAEFAELRGGVEFGAKLSDKVSGFIGGTIVRDLEDSTRSFLLSSTQLPTFSAILPQRELDRFELAGGLNIAVSDTFSIDVGYLGDFNEGYRAHSGRATVRIGF